MILKLDPNDLTLGDLEDFEDVTGLNFDEVFQPRPVIDPETGSRKLDDDGRPVSQVKLSPKAMVALIWIVGRKADPAMTLDAARAMKLTELQLVNAENGDDPKDETALEG